jgi:cobalt/nickel transport system permease protein
MTQRNKGILLVGLVVALLLAGVVSYYASSSPDGLNRVAIDKGFDKGEQEHAAKDSPLAGYSTNGIGNERLSGGLAGVAGVGVTLLIGYALVFVVRRRNAGDSQNTKQGAGLAGQRP